MVKQEHKLNKSTLQLLQISNVQKVIDNGMIGQHYTTTLSAAKLLSMSPNIDIIKVHPKSIIYTIY